eukprot:SAG31_NODE_9951_length_1206_cov_1.357724_2_plen_184_part_00
MVARLVGRAEEEEEEEGGSAPRCGVPADLSHHPQDAAQTYIYSYTVLLYWYVTLQDAAQTLSSDQSAGRRGDGPAVKLMRYVVLSKSAPRLRNREGFEEHSMRFFSVPVCLVAGVSLIHGDTFSISALHLSIKVPYFSNSGHKNEKVTALTLKYEAGRASAASPTANSVDLDATTVPTTSWPQ